MAHNNHAAPVGGSLVNAVTLTCFVLIHRTDGLNILAGFGEHLGIFLEIWKQLAGFVVLFFLSVLFAPGNGRKLLEGTDADQAVPAAYMMIEKRQPVMGGKAVEPEGELGQVHGQRIEIHAIDAMARNASSPVIGVAGGLPAFCSRLLPGVMVVSLAQVVPTN